MSSYWLFFFFLPSHASFNVTADIAYPAMPDFLSYEK